MIINEEPLTKLEIKRFRSLLKRMDKIQPLTKFQPATYKKMPIKQINESLTFLAVMVCKKHNITYENFICPLRKQYLVRARVDFAHIAFNKIIDNKYAIARFLHRKSHGTVINLLDKFPTPLKPEIESLFNNNEE
tara:strand:+ start:56 stop:460 length:405 start_codon:yes stop_codon:yes gene_type:complete